MEDSAEAEDGNQTTTNLLKQPSPNWEQLASERVITSRQQALLSRYDVDDPEVQAQCLEADGSAVANAILSVATTVSPRTNRHTAIYTLALLEDVLTVEPARASLFHQSEHSSDPSDTSSHSLYQPLLRLLDREDFVVEEKAAKSLSVLVARRSDPNCPAALSTIDHLLDWSEEHLRFVGEESCQRSNGNVSPDITQQQTSGISRDGVVLRVLSSLVVDSHARDKAISKGIVPRLAKASSLDQVHDMAPQVQYDFALVVWLLSFNADAIGEMRSTGLLQGLLAAVKTAAKEKVARVGLMALRNLLESGNSNVVVELAEHGLPRLVTAMRARSFTDEELNDALERVSKHVDTSIQEATSFDKYKAEVMSGNLDWSRVHTDESFWKEHVSEFEENEWKIVKQLLSIINSNGSTAKQLQVAAHDLGCFASHHPRGRNVLTDLQAKSPIIVLMQHSDPDVKKHAMLASQKVLVERSDFLTPQAAAT
jgi:V-type H+-transporting ATPase subunit H